MTTLLLVRHAETIWHADNRFAGRSDIVLTPNGEAQAQTFAARIAHEEISAIYSSTLRRARETAQPLAETLGFNLHCDSRLVEASFGLCEGLTRAEAAAKFLTAFTAYAAYPAEVALPGAETATECLNRVGAALDDIVAAYPEGRVVVVFHSHVLRLFVAQQLGLDLNRFRVLLPAVDNCSITELYYLGSTRATETELRRYNA